MSSKKIAFVLCLSIFTHSTFAHAFWSGTFFDSKATEWVHSDPFEEFVELIKIEIDYISSDSPLAKEAHYKVINDAMYDFYQGAIYEMKLFPLDFLLIVFLVIGSETIPKIANLNKTILTASKLYGIVIAPIREELVFRFYFQGVFNEIFSGYPETITFLTSLLFALGHYNDEFNLKIPYIFISDYFWHSSREYNTQSLAYVTGMHMMSNFLGISIGELGDYLIAMSKRN